MSKRFSLYDDTHRRAAAAVHEITTYIENTPGLDAGRTLDAQVTFVSCAIRKAVLADRARRARKERG